MILILKETATSKQIEELLRKLKKHQLSANLITADNKNIIVVTGETMSLSSEEMLSSDLIEQVQNIAEPYQLANRKFQPKDTVVSVGEHTIGSNELCVIAGPCSVEDERQILTVAKKLKKSGATMLRGGAYKPRTSPYVFQGLEEEGLRLLKLAKKETGLPIVTELTSLRYLEHFCDVDLIQVGARNMQNFEMLKELGHCKTPILLKRGFSNTLEEWLMSAEHIMAGGNPNVILCERGIRTYETATRNTLDISAVPFIKQHSHLPVIVDPSHASGIPSLVEPLSSAAVAAGADGFMIEVHPCPEQARSDGGQSILPADFVALMKKISPIASLCGKSVHISEDF